MKKLLFGAAMMLLVASCSGNGTHETTIEDSTGIDDSIAQVEVAKQTVQDSATQADSTATIAPEAQKNALELNVSAFYKKVGSGQYSFLSLKNIKQCLNNAGFTLKEKGTEKVIGGPYDDEVARYPEWTYENGSLEVEIVTYPNGSEVYYIDFEFEDKASADEFIKNAKADGFKKESYGLCKGTLVPLILIQKGKEVKLSALRDED